MQTMNRAFCFVLALSPFLFTPKGFSVEKVEASAATTLSSASPIVALTWPEVDGAMQFNIYRKESLTGAYPSKPLNSLFPIAPIKDSTPFLSLIPLGSTEWNALTYGLGSPGIPFDPLAIADLPRGSTEYAKLQFLARAYWKIAVAAGQGYKDTDVTYGTTYYYELRHIDAKKVETVLDTDIAITAGMPVLPSAPSGINAEAGDNKVLLTWKSAPEAAGYLIYRATSSAGVYQQVNTTTFVTNITADLEGHALSPSAPGFLDFQRWDANGNPDTHLVEGAAISGPSNGTTYYYKVASVNLLGDAGSASIAPVSATPVDTTPPKTPGEIVVTPYNAANQLEIKWAKVEVDTAGHVEPSILGYHVFRYDIPDGTNGVAVGGLVSQPASGIIFATAADSDPILRPLYGEQTFWYRIECIDSNGNVSGLSAAAAGYLSDVTAPANPKNVRGEGYDDYIRILWNPNSEPDLDGYLIYRSLCRLGKWVCDPRNDDTLYDNQKCEEPFELVGYLSLDEAAAIIASGSAPYYDDTTVPEGSPICYAYLVKAIDKAQNESGTMPPNPLLEEIVCARLRDRTPPEAAVITSLKSQDNAISIEWIGAPVQDIAAHHVYRADASAGPYTWVGGLTVEYPPASPLILSSPYKPAIDCGACTKITLETRDDMSEGSIVDSSVDPKKIYWYKVVGIDQCGNEGKLDDAIPVSTFTYSTQLPASPVISSVTVASPTPGLRVQWTPVYDPSQHAGFFVFRAENVAGPYLPISNRVAGNEYHDGKAIRGLTYWYQVLLISNREILSAPSSAVSGGAPKEE